MILYFFSVAFNMQSLMKFHVQGDVISNAGEVFYVVLGQFNSALFLMCIEIEFRQ